MASSSSWESMCSACGGSGEIDCGPGDVIQCPVCTSQNRGRTAERVCSACGGLGELRSETQEYDGRRTCPVCDGTGKGAVDVIVLDLAGEASYYTVRTYGELCKAYVKENLEPRDMRPSERVSFILEDGSILDRHNFNFVREGKHVTVHVVELSWFELKK